MVAGKVEEIYRLTRFAMNDPRQWSEVANKHGNSRNKPISVNLRYTCVDKCPIH